MFFAPSYNVGVPATPLNTVLIDLDHDGVDDALVSHPAGGFSVAFATSGGSFGPFTRAFTSHPARSLFVLDVDGDGQLDVAIGGDSNGTYGSILVAFGNGNGAWIDSAAVVVTPGSGILQAAGDLNGDGRGDLVFALQDADSVAVFRGNANRTLTRIGDSSLLDYPAAMRMGDVTGSTAPDLLVGYRDSTGYSVLPNLGGGVLGARTDFAGSAPFSAFRLAAIDGNPGLDLIANAFGLNSWTGLGGGAFGALGALDQGTFVDQFELCDFDHDGILDVVGARDFASPRKPSAWKGLGGGAFGPRIDSGGSQYGVLYPSLGDIDGDGNVDIVYTSIETPNLVYSLGNGDGTFGRSPSPPEIAGTIRSGAPGDFDGDGKIDEVASLNGSSLVFAKGHGDGTFDPFVVPSPNGVLGYNDVLAGSFDGDANLDAIGISSSTLSFFHGLGNGTFSAPVDFAVGAGPKRPTLVDLNGDGRIDVVVPCTGANSLSILMQSPTGLTAPTTAPMPAGPVAVRYRDLDADGRLDRVSACTGQLVVELADGLGGYGSPSSTSLPSALLDLALADVDGDGFPEALVSQATVGESMLLHVLKGHPGGTFDQDLVSEMRFWSAPGVIAAGSLRRIEAFDADDDGRVDVVIREGARCGALAARGNGDRTFGRSEAYGSLWNGLAFGIADFDGDGHQDVIVGGGRGASGSPSSIAVLLNRVGHVLAVPAPPTRAITLAIRALAPNPAHGSIALTIESAASGRAGLAIYGANGRLARTSREIALAAGMNQVPLDAAGLAPGLYWVRVTSGAASATRKLVVM